MLVVPLLSSLSQFGLFHQPQTSFTCSRNRESFTTLRRVSPRIEARCIRWKIMLTSSLRKIALLRSRDGAILFEEIGNSNRCYIFLEEYEASCELMTRAFCKSRKSQKGLFSWSGSACSLDVFQRKVAKGSKRHRVFFLSSQRELSSSGLLRKVWLNSALSD